LLSKQQSGHCCLDNAHQGGTEVGKKPPRYAVLANSLNLFTQVGAL